MNLTHEHTSGKHSCDIDNAINSCGSSVVFMIGEEAIIQNALSIAVLQKYSNVEITLHVVLVVGVKLPYANLKTLTMRLFRRQTTIFYIQAKKSSA